MNLLVVVEAVMQERNVTRAAEALAMSQPALSNALRRARVLLDDRLFEKASGGVRPTPKMIALWPDLHASLTTARRLIEPVTFDPAVDKTTFRVAITDNHAPTVIPELVLKLASVAPSANVHFLIHTDADSRRGLEHGTIDCAVGMFPVTRRTLRAQGLNADRYLCAMRKGHPLADSLNLQSFMAATHILVMPSGQEMNSIDDWLSLSGQKRTIFAVVNHFADALKIIADSDMITCVPSDFMRNAISQPFGGDRVVTCELPFETDRILYKLVWHERSDRHPAQKWFRKLLSSVYMSLLPSSQ